MTWLGRFLTVITSAMVFVLALWVFTPWLAAVRAQALWAGAGIGVAALAVAVWMAWRQPSRVAMAVVALACVGPLALATTTMQQRALRNAVMTAPPAKLAAVGRHVVVGYRTLGEVTPLIAKGAVGGLFVTARNARGKTQAQLAAEIADLQTVARANGHPPLIITTDQEGGFVSRLSPPLPRPAMMAPRLRAQATPEAQQRIAFEDGAASGRDLAAVGVTLNLAPLADLDFGIRNPADRMSRIGERALSRNADVVAMAARRYCEGLASAGVGCTLKHFPGLGRVADDTHVSSARLVTPRADLERVDWVPYQAGRIARGAAVMVGHVVAEAIDPEQPASLSRAVVTDALRGALSHTGVVITDDLCMAAVSDIRGGVGAGAVRAVEAGVDLLLISYDPEQVYGALSALLAASLDGPLAESRKRLDAARVR